MGMMVDNAIVVVDGFVVRLKQGMERHAAGIARAGCKGGLTVCCENPGRRVGHHALKPGAGVTGHNLLLLADDHTNRKESGKESAA